MFFENSSVVTSDSTLNRYWSTQFAGKLCYRAKIVTAIFLHSITCVLKVDCPCSFIFNIVRLGNFKYNCKFNLNAMEIKSCWNIIC